MKPAFSFGLVGLSALLCSSCAFGPDRVASAYVAPATWKEPDISAVNSAFENAAVIPATIPADWWQLFEDAELNRIEVQVVTANQDLQRATARVVEARALARLSASDLYPTFATRAGFSRERHSINRPRSPGQNLEGNDHSVGLDLSFEIDAFGRVRQQYEASRAEAAATASDREVVRNALTAEAARSYFQLRWLDAETAVIEATLALRRDTAQLLQTRRAAGLINELDVSRAHTEVATVEAELYTLARSRARLEHALAVLCGEAPAAFAVAPRAWEIALPVVPAGLPASLLQRRPDIFAAEQRVHAASARIGVAKADFFPRISLTAGAGLASTELGMLLNGSSRVWSFGPSLYLPIFNGGRNRAELSAAEARFDQSAAEYRRTVLRAFRDVEDALSDLAALSAQATAVARAVASARDTAQLANERYRQGLTSFLDVVDAERAALQSERQATQVRGERTLSALLLISALGGGWESGAIQASP